MVIVTIETKNLETGGGKSDIHHLVTVPPVLLLLLYTVRVSFTLAQTDSETQLIGDFSGPNVVNQLESG